MKDIRQKLLDLLKKGYCSPQIGRIAKKLKEPSATIHYNIKKLEKEGVIKSYKAVLDKKKEGKGNCMYVMFNISEEMYGSPEPVAEEIAKYPEVESVDICTGDHELMIKLWSKDTDEYYAFLKHIVKKYKMRKAVSITSLKQVKSEFV